MDKKILALRRENEILRKQLEDASNGSDCDTHNFDGTDISIGVLGDTHLGSLFSDLSVLKSAYRMFKERGIKNVYHAGDLLAGEKMYRGQEYELRVHGADAQIDFCVRNYPRVEGITTFFITGN